MNSDLLTHAFPSERKKKSVSCLTQTSQSSAPGTNGSTVAGGGQGEMEKGPVNEGGVKVEKCDDGAKQARRGHSRANNALQKAH